MITKWRLFNFKSVRNETILDFGQLTILAGPNSGGKSTIIQSILLVSQTVSSKVPSRSVVLNGSLVKLGQFDDIRSQGSESDQIAIGWKCTNPPALGALEGYFPSNPEQTFGIPGEAAIREAEMIFSFDTKGDEGRTELSQLHPSLYSSVMRASFSEPGGEPRDVEFSIVRRPTLQLAESIDIESVEPASLNFEVTLDKESLEEVEQRYASPTAIGTTTEHFFPVGLVVKYNLAKQQTRVFLTSMIERGFRPLPVRSRRDFIVPPPVLQVVNKYLGDDALILENWTSYQRTLFGEEPSVMLSDLLGNLGRLPFAQKKMLRAKLDEESFGREIAKAFLSSVKERSVVARTQYPELIRQTSAYLKGFFSHGIKYLGPLRDEPKALYPLTAAMEPNDVGLKGEFTAAILDLHKDTTVAYIPSEAFGTPQVDRKKQTNRRLQTAVTDWLEYLGIAEDVSTKDLGKLGHELKVLPGSLSRPIDLTHVGVGVSQVLPILVSCLLAGPDATLIFEQPELHLHPKIQTRLGDFFLSMALIGKQCIVETHSEYLINRLRFRAAASRDEKYSALLRMYFVERTEGVSSFRPVVVNDYGAILDWPEGFFDQSQQETEDIIRFGMMKREEERRRIRKDA